MGGAVYLYYIMEQYTPSPALRTSEADLSGRSNERKRCFRLENIRRYFKRTDKTYLLLCIFSSVMAVTALSSWAAKQGNGFAVDEITGQITGLGDYRRAAVQAGAALIGLVIAVLLSNIDYRSLVKVWPVHVALTWGMVLPTLVLPVDQKVTIHLQSRDVIHSFWIIDFLYKKDMYIGKDNYWSFTPTRVGEYDGKCAELCGQYHSMMLFKVKVVEQAEYDAYLDGLRDAGQTGDINEAYNRLQNLPGTGASESKGDH